MRRSGGGLRTSASKALIISNLDLGENEEDTYVCAFALLRAWRLDSGMGGGVLMDALSPSSVSFLIWSPTEECKSVLRRMSHNTDSKPRRLHEWPAEHSVSETG